MLFLGRAMVAADGFRARPGVVAGAFDASQRLFYDGNSQGGIEGGALTAIAPDFDRAVLGVPGMNYSTLLQRSVDFAPFRALLEGAYRTRSTGASSTRCSPTCGTAASPTATRST